MNRKKIFVLALSAALSGVPAASFAYTPQHHGEGARPVYHFRPEDREHLHPHYQNLHQHVDMQHRWHFVRGSRLPDDWHTRIVALPPADIALLPPAPPGYLFGYYDGWAVIYDPNTGMILDAVDVY